MPEVDRVLDYITSNPDLAATTWFCAAILGYRRVPPTEREDGEAVASLRAAIAEEPW